MSAMRASFLFVPGYPDVSRNAVWALCRLPKSFWRGLPTIYEGAMSDLKLSTSRWRVALSRLTVADGVDSDFCVQIFAKMPDGGWDCVALISDQQEG